MPTTSNSEVGETRSTRMSIKRDRLTAFTSLLRPVLQLEAENEQAQRTIVKVKSRLSDACMDCPKKVLIINLHADTDESRRGEFHIAPPKSTVVLVKTTAPILVPILHPVLVLTFSLPILLQSHDLGGSHHHS